MALVLTVALGLVSRRWPVGFYLYDKSFGDALYAVMVYLLVTLLLPRLSLFHFWTIALSVCLSIELFKLTGLPNAWRASAISRLAFGTTFSFHNLACYAVGITLVALADRFVEGQSAASRVAPASRVPQLPH